MKKYYLLLAVWTLALPISAQIIQGLVVDTAQGPVPFASVVATGCRDERVLAFVHTNSAGEYRLQLSNACDSIVLTVRALLYEPAQIHLRLVEGRYAQNFVLQSTGRSLQEVLVRGHAAPVRTRPDTIEYHAAAFSDSTEFSVEDLLKKLPGVSIDAKGVITHNGKLVERVLVEGDDLFSNNYTIATRNLRADMVSKVQVIDRYQENPLLKAVQESDRLVMNLVVKEEKKYFLSGSASLGLGYGKDPKGLLQGSAFSIGRRNKVFGISNVNNSGSSALAVAAWADRPNPLDRSNMALQANPFQTHPLIAPPAPQNLGLPDPYTQFNRSALLYLGQSASLSPKFTLKTSAWAGQEQIRQSTTSLQKILLGKDFLTFGEHTQTWSNKKLGNVQMEGSWYSPEQGRSLRFFVKAIGQPLQHCLEAAREVSSNLSTEISQIMVDKPMEVFSSVEYTAKKGKDWAFQLLGKQSFWRNQSDLASKYAPYADYFGVDGSFDSLLQKAPQQGVGAWVATRLLAFRGRTHWVFEGGLDAQTRRLASELRVENGFGGQWSPEAALYSNQARFRSLKYYANISASHKFGPWRTTAGLVVRYQPLAFFSPQSTIHNNHAWGAEPSLSIRYKKPDRHAAASISYTYRLDPPSLGDLLPAWFLGGYSSAVRGLPALSFTPFHQANIQYQYYDPTQMRAWRVGVHGRMVGNDWGIRYYFDPYLSLQNKFRPVQNVLYGIHTSGNYLFDRLSVRAEFGFDLNKMKERIKINSETGNQLDTYLTNFYWGVGSAFDTWVNGVFKSTCNIATVLNRSGAEGQSFQTVQWFNRLEINIRPSNRFHVKAIINHISNPNAGTGHRSVYAGDLLAQLQLPDWHSEVALQVFNVLGSRTFTQVMVDRLAHGRFSVDAVPLFGLLRWNRSF